MRSNGIWSKISGNTLEDAKAALRNRVNIARAIAVGVPVQELADSTPLTQALAAYLEEIQANKAHKTWVAYRSSLKVFAHFLAGRAQQVSDEL